MKKGEDKHMEIRDIAKYIVKNYPYCCMAANKVPIPDEPDEEYEKSALLDELLDFFAYEKLGLCGCGIPEDTWEIIRKILIIRKQAIESDIPLEETKKQYKRELNLDVDSETGNGILQFILYELDESGLVDHGSSIQGCWLTNEGKMYLYVLEVWHAQEIERRIKNEFRIRFIFGAAQGKC